MDAAKPTSEPNRISTTSELAADVQAVERAKVILSPAAKDFGYETKEYARLYLDAVARIADLEAQVEFRTATIAAMCELHEASKATAEAQVSALTNGRKLSEDGAFEAIVPFLEGDTERHLYAQAALDNISGRLATARQALTEIANEARPPKSNQFVGSVGKCGEVARRALAAEEPT